MATLLIIYLFILFIFLLKTNLFFRSVWEDGMSEGEGNNESNETNDEQINVTYDNGELNDTENGIVTSDNGDLNLTNHEEIVVDNDIGDLNETNPADIVIANDTGDLNPTNDNINSVQQINQPDDNENEGQQNQKKRKRNSTLEIQGLPASKSKRTLRFTGSEVRADDNYNRCSVCKVVSFFFFFFHTA